MPTDQAGDFSIPESDAVGKPARVPTAQTASYRAAKLSERDLRIAMLIHCAHSNAEIGALLGTTEQTVKNSVRMLFDKLGFWNRLELALWYEVHHCDGKCLQDLNR
jgi:DNA-binding NarL/FixJ family response regulator